MEPKLLNFWETGVCGDLTGGMWDWTTVTERKHNILFNIICIMGLFDISSGTVECQMLSQLKRLDYPCRRIR